MTQIVFSVICMVSIALWLLLVVSVAIAAETLKKVSDDFSRIRTAERMKVCLTRLCMPVTFAILLVWALLCPYL